MLLSMATVDQCAAVKGEMSDVSLEVIIGNFLYSEPRG
jgi:hypothetical protein